MQQQQKVLIVEDEKDTVDMLNELLGRQPYHYDFAETQTEAQQKLSNWCPDVMILDLRIPRYANGPRQKDNGVQVAQEAKKMSKPPKVIVWSGDTTDYLNKLLERNINVNKIISKESIDFEELETIISTALTE